MDDAVKILREKGIASGGQAPGRGTGEGVVETYVHAGGKIGAMVEIGSETDFVARTDDFKAFARKVACRSPQAVTSGSSRRATSTTTSRRRSSRSSGPRQRPRASPRRCSTRSQTGMWTKSLTDYVLGNQPSIRPEDDGKTDRDPPRRALGHARREHRDQALCPLRGRRRVTSFGRILLKLSGEALMGEREYGQDPERISAIPRRCMTSPVFGRGTRASSSAAATSCAAPKAAKGSTVPPPTTPACWRPSSTRWPCRTHSSRSVSITRVLSAIDMAEVAEPFIRRRAIRHLEKGRVVILAAGTGNPFFTTDTAAALRASRSAPSPPEGRPRSRACYSADPDNPAATGCSTLTYIDVLERGLKVMDSTALSLCMDNRMPHHRVRPDTGQHRARDRSASRSGHASIAATPSDDRDKRTFQSKIAQRIADANQRMEKSVEALHRELMTVRTGRASPACWSGCTSTTTDPRCRCRASPAISVPEASMLVIPPYDRSSLGAIEKAIQKSDLGLNPSNDGQVIRVADPAAHRGAAQGSRQGDPSQGRGGARRRAQHPPRRGRPPQGAREGRPRQQGRGPRRRDRPAEDHRCTLPPSTTPPEGKRLRSWRSDHGASAQAAPPAASAHALPHGRSRAR